MLTQGSAHFCHKFLKAVVFLLACLLLFDIIERTQVELALGHRLQRFTFELGQIRYQPLVDAIMQQQYFNALLAEDFQVRTVFCCGKTIRRDIVNFFLARFHVREVFGERYLLHLAIKLRTGKT